MTTMIVAATASQTAFMMIQMKIPAEAAVIVVKITTTTTITYKPQTDLNSGEPILEMSLAVYYAHSFHISILLLAFVHWPISSNRVEKY